MAREPVTSKEKIWELCLDCATNIYNQKKPTPEYAKNVALLLLGTAAHESKGFRYRRQTVYSYRTVGGGFGLWQVQANSVENSVQNLIIRPNVMQRSSLWLFEDPRAENIFDILGRQGICQGMLFSDKLGVLMARLHYLWILRKIPSSLGLQANYWKKYYNTKKGKGTVEAYVKNWKRYIDENDKTRIPFRRKPLKTPPPSVIFPKRTNKQKRNGV